MRCCRRLRLPGAQGRPRGRRRWRPAPDSPDWPPGRTGSLSRPIRQATPSMSVPLEQGLRRQVGRRGVGFTRGLDDLLVTARLEQALHFRFLLCRRQNYRQSECTATATPAAKATGFVRIDVIWVLPAFDTATVMPTGILWQHLPVTLGGMQTWWLATQPLRPHAQPFQRRPTCGNRATGIDPGIHPLPTPAPEPHSRNTCRDQRLKIAVFIDFDNVEIGVKTTLGLPFDIGAVLEAIKERGEIITKVAYGDWKRSGDYGRAMSHTPFASCSACRPPAATRTAPTSTSRSTPSKWRSPTPTSTPSSSSAATATSSPWSN